MGQKTTKEPVQNFFQKIVFLGDETVGKTCIIRRFIYNDFKKSYDLTICVDFKQKTVEVDKKSIRLLLQDTPGKERYKIIIPRYIKYSNAVIICYDITNEKSFQSIPSWIKMVKEERGDEALIYILGNKTDLVQNRQVPTDLAGAKAKELGANFSEVSAQSGHNAADFFKKIQQDLAENLNQQGST